ncbi:MAG: dienelactone hydrolase family protein [Proteobacteria bacterium]|nr:dienelactone hydrolase family protein [Pseudomonadota bacterium]
MPEVKIDPDALYREDVYTDRKAGTIRQMTPVDRAGGVDAKRKILYVGEMQLMTPMGTLPLAFEIDATSLGEAAEKFPELAQAAMERTVKELQQMRREAASQIVVYPEAGHGFYADYRASYRREDAEAAFAQAIGFFASRGLTLQAASTKTA